MISARTNRLAKDLYVRKVWKIENRGLVSRGILKQQEEEDKGNKKLKEKS